MVTAKRCAYGSCRNDSGYPQSWKEIQAMIPLSFFPFSWQFDKGRVGIMHVIAVTRSFVRRIVTFAGYTLLMEMVQQKTIRTQYQLFPVKKR